MTFISGSYRSRPLQRTPTYPKFLDPSPFVDLSQSYSPQQSHPSGASSLRRGSQMVPSLSRTMSLERRRGFYSPGSAASLLDAGSPSLMKIRSVTPREGVSNGDYFEAQMDRDGVSFVPRREELTPSPPRRGSRLLGGGYKIVNGSVRLGSNSSRASSWSDFEKT